MQLLNDSLLDLKRSLKKVVEKVSMLSDEINNFAHRTEMITLQRYIEFWEPIDFVTRKEVNDFLRKKFKENNISFSKNANNNYSNKVNNQDKEEPNKSNKKSIEDAYPDNN